MTVFADYRAFVGAHPEKVFKATLFQSERLLLGLNCLEPGQEQPGKGERRKLKAERPDISAFRFLISLAPAPGK